MKIATVIFDDKSPRSCPHNVGIGCDHKEGNGVCGLVFLNKKGCPLPELEITDHDEEGWECPACKTYNKWQGDTSSKELFLKNYIARHQTCICGIAFDCKEITNF